MTYRKKLIEVAMPLDIINAAAYEERYSRQGHPFRLHIWWARRPLVVCRAVLFASLVDDPSNDLPEEQAAKDRERIFRIIKDLLRWDQSDNQAMLQAAANEIFRSTGGRPPAVLDPFCGGGSIPIEAKRLGLEVYASDLNPVAALLTKAMIQIPSKFAKQPPLNPNERKDTGTTAAWKGISGLARDARYYGRWMHDEAFSRIGQVYPRAQNGQTVVAWLWARTVQCPNPACGAEMPLMRTFWLSTKQRDETRVEPVVDKARKTVRFEVRHGRDRDNTQDGTVNRNGARCIVCGATVAFDHIRAEGRAGRMKEKLIAIVAENEHGHTYLSPTEEHEEIANSALPNWKPETHLPERALGFRVQLYGMTQHYQLFTNRQLMALSTFCELITEVHKLVLKHSGNREYADALVTYLSFVLDRCADRWCTLAVWQTGGGKSRGAFARQALPMTWDFVEANPFCRSSGNWLDAVEILAKALEALPMGVKPGFAYQFDASAALPEVENALVFTDPPYYDNIGYADLSDFFYVWLRRSLNTVYPELFSTVLTPKTQELVATPYRFEGDKKRAEEHFEAGLGKAFSLMRKHAHPDYPITLYYAFKQQEEGEHSFGIIPVSTGWETMLQGILDSNLQITGTWPLRTEMQNRQVAMNTNALASSIVISCRARPDDAPIATRREFLSALRKELPQQLNILMTGRVAPVDLSQASIGPGMAVFSRYSKVLEADGSAMTVRTALQEINYFLEDYLAQQEGDLDVDSQFCVAWFQQYGSKEGAFGEADVLARAKNVSVDGLARLGLVEAARGKVRLALREGYEESWDPRTESRLTIWEACQRLVWSLSENGERETGRLARRLGGLAEQARQLSYRLYGIADRKGWAHEASGYNALVASWPEIQKAAAAAAEETQGRIIQDGY